MRTILTLLCIVFVCSCDSEWSAGGGGPSAHIDVRSSDEPAVIRGLESWLSDHGYEKRTQSWAELTGDGVVANNSGEVVYPVPYVKELSKGRGHIAWGVASATDSHEFVTVFHDSEFNAVGKEALDKIEGEVDREDLAFHNFVDTSFSSSPESEKAEAHQTKAKPAEDGAGQPAAAPESKSE
jgi:hypothetical protein